MWPQPFSRVLVSRAHLPATRVRAAGAPLIQGRCGRITPYGGWGSAASDPRRTWALTAVGRAVSPPARCVGQRLAAGMTDGQSLEAEQRAQRQTGAGGECRRRAEDQMPASALNAVWSSPEDPVVFVSTSVPQAAILCGLGSRRPCAAGREEKEEEGDASDSGSVSSKLARTGFHGRSLSPGGSEGGPSMY